jgi:lipopolysaccharide/colanic/teichoic acid biosynthesis glycosyltransferase
MTTTLLLALFIAVVGQFMADEVKAWFGWLHQKVRRMAVVKLPPERRERYDEEWESGLAEIPGDIFRLIYSIGLLRAAIGIRNVALKSAANSETPYALQKRVVDIVFSGLVLIFLMPLLAAIAIAIKLDSSGPAFYITGRIGKKGRLIQCIKFRTMVLNPEERRTNIIQMNERDGGLFKPSKGWRITRLGRFLRKYSLDELPQLFNVLKGDMSIVGPRPPTASEVREYKLSDLRRLDMTPGITGAWQVEGRQDPSSASPKSLNETYAQNMSIWLYLKIIMRTIIEVFKGTDL